MAAVEAGRADYVSAVPVESVGGLEQRYGAHSPAARTGGQRYFSGPAPVLHRLEFNPESALFARNGCGGRSARRWTGAQWLRA